MPVKIINDLPTMKAWQPKRLYKETTSEFLPSECNTLQVGSLEYFRKHYKDEIADPREGKANFTINALGSWVEVSSWLNNTTYGVFGGFFDGLEVSNGWPKDWSIDKLFTFTSGKLNLDHETLPGDVEFKVQLRKAKDLDLISAVCVISYSAANSLIYCLKRSVPNSSVLKDCDQYWEIPSGEVETFALNMAKSLLAQSDKWSVRRADTNNEFLASDLGSWKVQKIYEKNLSEECNYILYSIRDVIYVASAETVMLAINYPWSWSKALMFNASFFKGPTFELQEETRIVFHLVKRIGDRFIGLNPTSETIIISIPDEMRSQIGEH
jgi:hypothetical protein